MSPKRSRWHFLPAAEHRFLCAFLLAQALTLTHFVHDAYAQAERHMAPGTAVCFFGDCGTPHAPEAYRVGVETVGTALLRLTHTQHPSVIAALLDFLFWLPALYLLSAVAVPPESDRPRRLLSLGLFLALAQFPLAWVVPWQRSETAPSALFVAALLCWVARSRRNSASLVLLLALAVWQSFVRADVALAAGLGLAVWAVLSSQGKRLTLSGVAITAIAALTQLYLQFIRFPHLTYDPGTRPIQLAYNFTHTHQLEVVALALLPFILIPALTPRTTANSEPSLLALALTMAALYFPLWLIFGVLQEVRVFVPFLLGIAATLAPVLARRLLAAEA